MGLAASQARFLGITLRKANCEFKSTELAQQRLELTNQMTDIAQEYANAMNATKLVWHNDMVTDSFGNPMDYGLSYSLLMMPSAANDYNPYMVSTRSGAIVLNSKFKAAAEAAGISEGGGTASAAGRKKFLASLANGKFDENGNVVTDNNGLVVDSSKHDNVITKYTYDILEQTTGLVPKTDKAGNVIKNANGQVVYETGVIAPVSKDTLDSGVEWHSAAGMGATPLNKAGSDITHLSDLVNDSSIGGQEVDWLQIERALLGFDYGSASTTAQDALGSKSYSRSISNARSKLRSYEESNGRMNREQVNMYSDAAEKAATSLVKNILADYYKTNYSDKDARDKAKNDTLKKLADAKNPDSATLQSLVKNLEVEEPNPDDFITEKYANGESNPRYTEALNAYNLKVRNAAAYAEETYKIIANLAYWDFYQEVISDKGQNAGERAKAKQELENAINPPNNEEGAAKNKLCWAIYQQASSDLASSALVSWKDSGANTKYKIEVSDLFNTKESRILDDPNTNEEFTGVNEKNFQRLTLAVNDVICTDASAIRSLTLADLLTQNVVLTARGDNSVESVGLSAKAIMDYIGEVFGVNSPGTGLNVDDESAKALEKALSTVKKLFLNNGSAVAKGVDTKNILGKLNLVPGFTNDSALNTNQAYINANDFNRIGTNNDRDYAAVNISNMVSAFLTYYDNYLRGSESNYIVGKGNTDGKTVFVTDDPNYVYVASNTEALTNDEKIADFYNQLYNNICDKGWRYDDMVQDSEHLESAVKDGRYQIMELNSDGYFYQKRYNDIGHMEEVHDADAVARAEADYQTKKAQITFKEDQIDVKTKKLDAEITELNTEINSVQNIISKNIEKTFTMFSN